MRQAYLVQVMKQDEVPSALTMRYAALVRTPNEALEAVRTLVADNANLSCKGETLSPIAARALGLKPGQARLV